MPPPQYSIYVPIFSRMFPNAAKYAAMPIRDKIKDVAGTCPQRDLTAKPSFRLSPPDYPQWRPIGRTSEGWEFE